LLGLAVIPSAHSSTHFSKPSTVSEVPDQPNANLPRPVGLKRPEAHKAKAHVDMQSAATKLQSGLVYDPVRKNLRDLTHQIPHHLRPIRTAAGFHRG
jgi:hypothetical protein